MKNRYIDFLFHLEMSLNRRLELFRGNYIRWRGGQVGTYFGLGRSTRVICPSRFSAGDHVTIGDFSYLDCISIEGVKIGHHSSFDRNLWLSCGGKGGASTGFFEIGHHSYVGCNAVIGAGGGGIRIGNNVLIGQAVKMHSERHVYKDSTLPIREQGIEYQGIVIDDDVWIGSGSTILDGVTIETGAVIGSGAVVTKSISAYSVAVGIPAKIIGTRENIDENRDLS